MGDREELQALRRMAELEAKAGIAPPTSPAPTQSQAPGSEPLPPLSQRLRDIGMAGVRGVTSGQGPLGAIAGMAGEGMRQSGELLNRGAYRAGGAVTDIVSGMGASPEVAGGAGYAANVGMQAIPTVLGAGAGRAVQPAVTAPFKAVGRAARNLVDPWLPGGVDRAVGRAAVNAAGPKSQAVIEALKQNRQIVPGSMPTAGEAAASAGSAEFSGLQNIVKGKDPSAYFGRAGQQEGARLDAIREIGKDKTALQAAEVSRKEFADPLYAAARAGTKPVNTAPVTAKVDLILKNNPGNRELVTELKNIKKGLEEAGSDPQKVASVLDGMKASIKDEKNKFIGGILNKIKDDLVEAIPGYRKAQAVFAVKSTPVNRMQVGQELEKSLQSSLGTAERPSSFATAVRNAPQTIKRATGQPRYEALEDVLSPSQTKAVGNVLEDLQRSAAHEQLAKAGTEKAREVVGQVAPALPAAGMFNPKYSVLRAISNRFAGRIEGKSLERLAKGMQDPELMAKLMQAATPAERVALVRVFGPRVFGTTAGAIGGGAVGYESGQQ